MNMKIYRGDYSEKFEVKPWLRSRYGFHCLFFTTDIALARLYAIHAAQERRMLEGGSVYEAEINDLWIYPFDFGGQSSFGADFRNMIHTFRDFKQKAVRIFNLYDYPSQKSIRMERTDVVAVFDFQIIQNLKLKELNIWKP